MQLATLRTVLAYVATKKQFIKNAPEIADVVRDAVRGGLGIRIRKNSSEYRSWQNSLGNAMFHVLNSPLIPDDAGVAIEYQLRGRRQRIDVMVSGYGSDGSRCLVIVELKQWVEVASSQLTDHVSTFLGGAVRNERHPSYQAWSYGGLLTGFCEVVASDPIRIYPCAFVHNCNSSSVLRGLATPDLLKRSPVFIKGEHRKLRKLITDSITSGDNAEGVHRIESSAITPSAQLVQSLNSMLKGNEIFILIDEQKTAFETIMNLVRSVPAGEHYVLMVSGGPGTGKSVIAINALVRLLGENFNVRYVTKMLHHVPSTKLNFKESQRVPRLKISL